MQRQIFNFDNLEESVIIKLGQKQHIWSKPISAGGIIFYKPNINKILLTKCKFKSWWEDLGGKVEIEDETIWSTIIREVNEESNGHISIKYLDIMNHKLYYVPSAKYAYVVYKVADDWLCDTTIFGTCESHNGLKRKLEWVDVYDLKHKYLSPRLQSHDIFDILCKTII
jgi:hypothetical protein